MQSDDNAGSPPRRGLNEVEAANYLSLSASKFRQLVESGIMPRPRLCGRRRIFDVIELNMAFLDLPKEGELPSVKPNSWSDFD